MISQDDILIDGDTAWLVTDEFISTPGLRINTNILDRPCDNEFTHDDTWDCPDCDNTGRHTFTVDIEGEGVRQVGNLLRVHISEVLPIVDEWGRDPFDTPRGITLPPNAAPGKYAVRLAVHDVDPQVTDGAS